MHPSQFRPGTPSTPARPGTPARPSTPARPATPAHAGTPIGEVMQELQRVHGDNASNHAIAKSLLEQYHGSLHIAVLAAGTAAGLPLAGTLGKHSRIDLLLELSHESLLSQ